LVHVSCASGLTPAADWKEQYKKNTNVRPICISECSLHYTDKYRSTITRIITRQGHQWRNKNEQTEHRHPRQITATRAIDRQMTVYHITYSNPSTVKRHLVSRTAERSINSGHAVCDIYSSLYWTQQHQPAVTAASRNTTQNKTTIMTASTHEVVI